MIRVTELFPHQPLFKVSLEGGSLIHVLLYLPLFLQETIGIINLLDPEGKGKINFQEFCRGVQEVLEVQGKNEYRVGLGCEKDKSSDVVRKLFNIYYSGLIH